MSQIVMMMMLSSHTVTFHVLPITHSAVAAGSRQQRVDDACALDQSHSAPSGDAPLDLSSHLLFDNHSAAEMRNTPDKVNGKIDFRTTSCLGDEFYHIKSV